MGHKTSQVMLASASSSANNRLWPAACAHGGYNITANPQTIQFKDAGEATNFRVVMFTNSYSGAASMDFMQNGSSVSALSIPAGSTAPVADDSTTVSIAADDEVQWNLTRGSANASNLGTAQFAYKTSGSTSIIKNAASGTVTVSTTKLNWPIVGITTTQTEDDAIQIPIKVACTAKYLSAYINSNTASVTTNAFLRDGASDAITLAITAGATGRVTNVSDTYSLTTSSKVSYSAQRTGGSGSLVMNTLQCDFEYSGDAVQYFSAVSGGTANTASTSRYLCAVGGFIFGGGESPHRTRLFETGTIDDLSLYISASATSGTTNFIFLLQGATTAVTLNVGAAATGQFDDSTNSFTFTDGQHVDIRTSRTAGTESQTLNWITWVCTYDPLPVSFIPQAIWFN